MDCITFRNGYKYQLKSEYHVDIPIKPPKDIGTEYILLTLDGNLTIKRGYAWDGPSGPTFDTRTFMRGSLVHDAMYQLMREGHLDNKTYRGQADKLLRTMCRQDGMNPLRAWWVYQGVKLFANFAADPAKKKPPVLAPKICE